MTQTPTGEKVTYSRVERAKTLPNTGEQTSLLWQYYLVLVLQVQEDANKDS
ncbi:TPA: hypothetical protein TZY74_001402 [Streptococcus suis]|uniref:LPXTG cell wall surface protein n=1 Tax=Streptococcus suis TaxID=1307 RepID=A0A116LID8_STRSU|nr:hypothetical protein [Streptococcus suis]MCQ8785918.1 hypothetical protein [Streptococcus suis]MDW8721424.1 hypothetical protein [Streptococcus suis]NQH42575.1 hypothetical protein [Streptococcus suis]NQH56382.1 hypothetical protein [Streptococcus suis]NQM35323.1 hypothetical protein [Streptococcus suis]